MTLNEAIRATFPGCYCHVAESGDTLFIQHLVVTTPARSNSLIGTGYRIARALCNYADARELPIVINAQRAEGFKTDEEKLRSLYTRLGFVDYKGVGPRSMIRYPKPYKGLNHYGETDKHDRLPDGAGSVGVSHISDDPSSGYRP